MPTSEIRSGLRDWIEEIRAGGTVYFWVSILCYGTAAAWLGWAKFAEELPSLASGLSFALLASLGLKISERRRAAEKQRGTDLLPQVATYVDIPVTGKGTYALHCLARLLQERGSVVTRERILRHVLRDLRDEGELKSHEIESGMEAADYFLSLYLDAGILTPWNDDGNVSYRLNRPLAREVLLATLKSPQVPPRLFEGWRRW
jgi:hypothetical protein